MKARYLLAVILISLATIGLVSFLIKDPLALLRSIFIYAAVAGIIYFIYRKWFSSKPKNKEQRAFAKAAKMSKKRIKKKNPTVNASGQKPKKKPIRKKSTAQLTVIEGKKNKKNKRASL
ncbi:membrane protein implicated in regulation of membrane protease activity [Bacillus pakistanensis]|uniref:Membrane protein implicated in regulation of membrane protease activity n=1 Tax=Rossellomorea pakistanensis TaxID=992288 RepID=A0ABS2N9S0_9BACI|nr:SA1362 family protein [Bacillus pakistanensis]MBM7584592.1 membrane protein implicated in regulation of membrane protease activity [Bacillus pakistanensis]